MTGLLERIDERLERIEARLAKCGDGGIGAVGGDVAAGSDGIAGPVVDQRRSALGRRRHCAAVRRRRAAGDDRAFVVGRRHLMTAELYAEELARVSLAPPAANDAAEATSTYDRALAKALGIK